MSKRTFAKQGSYNLLLAVLFIVELSLLKL